MFQLKKYMNTFEFRALTQTDIPLMAAAVMINEPFGQWIEDECNNTILPK